MFASCNGIGTPEQCTDEYAVFLRDAKSKGQNWRASAVVPFARSSVKCQFRPVSRRTTL
jgi:hypothetical protein